MNYLHMMGEGEASNHPPPPSTSPALPLGRSRLFGSIDLIVLYCPLLVSRVQEEHSLLETSNEQEIPRDLALDTYKSA